ncbi:MAG: YkgJ family cysteine cluster protein [Rudaea sp.]
MAEYSMIPREQADLLELERQVEKETTQKLRANPTAAFAVRLAAVAQLKIDQVHDEVVGKGVRFACAKGCSYCCQLKVDAYPQETFRIARGLRERTHLTGLMEALATHASRNKDVIDKRSREPCPFLVDHACSIYAMRPAMCRKTVSLDVERCKAFAETVPSDPEMFYKSNAIISGSAKAYARKKVASAAHELVSSVLLALTDSSAEARWWNGEDVFAAAPIPAVSDSAPPDRKTPPDPV